MDLAEGRGGQRKGAKKVRSYPSVPAEGLPDGWVTRRIRRNSTNKVDTFWYSPHLQLRFRSSAEVQRFLVHLERAGGDEGAAIEAFNGNHHIEMASSSNRSSSSKKSAGLPKKSSSSASSVIVNVGDVGYKFRKQFDDGWYEGVVVKIRPGAVGGRDRRCHYEDGDSEDLSLAQLRTLALLDPTVTKKKASKSSESDDDRAGDDGDVHLPLPRNGSEYTRLEAIEVLTAFPKFSRKRSNAIRIATEKGWAPISQRNIYKMIEKAESGGHIHDSNWNEHWRAAQKTATEEAPASKWDQRFSELKEYKRKYGDANVPFGFEENAQLASWVASQRAYYKNYTEGKERAYINAEKIAKLKSVGFVFSFWKRNQSDKDEDEDEDEYEDEDEDVMSEVEASDGEEANVARRSGRKVKAPRKIDEIYNYEHVKSYHTKKARLGDKATTPEKKEQLLMSLDNDIPDDSAAANTLNFNASSEKVEGIGTIKNEADVSDDDDEKWLEKVAVSLGANTKNLEQKKLARPFIKRLSTSASSLDGPAQSNMAKADAASICSTVTGASDGKSGKRERDAKAPPAESVLVDCESNTDNAVAEQSAPEGSLGGSGHNVPLPLLSELSRRFGCLVFHKNDKNRIVGEVILEEGSWVSCSIDGVLKKYRAKHLIVVPSNQFKAGDIVPLSFCDMETEHKRAGPTKNTRPKPHSEKKPALPVEHLFCWYCEECDAANKVFQRQCHSCNAEKTAESKRSILLGLAEKAVMGSEGKTVEETMNSIAYSDRPSIPEKLVSHLLEAKSLGEHAPCFNFKPKSSIETYFYWMCGFCTTQNTYARRSCSACLQGKDLAERSPLLTIAEDVAANCQTTDEALSLLPKRERALIPTVVLDAIVTCVFIREDRNGQRKRCMKRKKPGYDYCEAHIDPLLLSKSRSDAREEITVSPPCGEEESLHLTVIEKRPLASSKIAAIGEFMPSVLSEIQSSQVNELKWTISSIEDAVLCGENSAYPLGFKVRKFFPGYGFHDGRLTRATRKIHKEGNQERPVLVYRCKYNDGDQEDFLHHEITSLTQLYDRCGVSPLAPPAEQIPPGALFETRNGHTIEIISHHTPPGSASQDEGGTVSVHFHGSSSHLEIDLVELQKAILRRIEVPPPARNCRDGEEVNDEIESNATDKATKSAPEKSVSSPLENDMAATLLKLGSAPVLEWPPKQSGTNSGGPDQEEICQGLSLHRKLCNESPDVVKIPASSVVDNPRDIRPGCTYRMWDPAGVYNYLSWDPYASTVCELCGVDKDDNQVVICDECHSGFHTYCLRPVMVNIPKDDWICSACSGRSNVQLSFQDYLKNMSCGYEEMMKYLNLPYSNPGEFFETHSVAMSLFASGSQAAVKQHAVKQQVQTKHVVFDVGRVKFVRAPEKNDWALPTPLLSEDVHASSITSIYAAMKYCGMKSSLNDLAYSAYASEEMNDPSLEVDPITPMSRRNLEIFRAYKHNTRLGIFPPIQIIYDENFGFSVKALASMPRHTIIGEYLGEVTTVEHSGQSNSDSLMVLLDTGDPQTSLIIDPTHAGNIARFLSGINNRSLLSKRKANVRTRRFQDNGKVHVCLFTSRRVEAGEILNYDYNAGHEGKDVETWAKSGFYDTSNFF